jgi:hypothetical protein
MYNILPIPRRTCTLFWTSDINWTLDDYCLYLPGLQVSYRMEDREKYLTRSRCDISLQVAGVREVWVDHFAVVVICVQTVDMPISHPMFTLSLCCSGLAALVATHRRDMLFICYLQI